MWPSGDDQIMCSLHPVEPLDVVYCHRHRLRDPECLLFKAAWGFFFLFFCFWGFFLAQDVHFRFFWTLFESTVEYSAAAAVAVVMAATKRRVLLLFAFTLTVDRT